jgi:hypothetical protein
LHIAQIKFPIIMHRTNKIIVAIVIVLVLAFGFAQFFSFSGSSTVNPSSSSSSSTTASEAVQNPATQVVVYEPQQPASSTPIEKGSCWTNSIAAPFRGDAWRCTVGNGITDPCFQIPGSTSLLCGANPANPDATSSFVLQLTKPLPRSQPVQGLQPSGQAWLVELQGGTLCTPFTGTLPFTATGDAASYGCAPGLLGKEVDIFNINSSSTVWTADIGTLASAPANSTSGLPVITTSSTVPIVAAWE